jgi:hypothetical protein
MDNNWIYNYQSVSGSAQLPQNTLGFVYSIRNLVDNKNYIGKKHIKKGANWLTYWGSSEDLKADIKKYRLSDPQAGVTRFEREILQCCATNIDLTYYEVWWQMHYNVLITNSYNKCILGKFYKGKISG